MSDLLMGGEMSGTPLETRAGTRATAGRTMRGAGPRDNLMEELFQNPRDSLSGMFAALEPFEQRETANQVAGMRSGFGRLGGRFGRSATDAETQLRGELANQFMRSREEATMTATAQMLEALIGARGQDFGFFQAGAPNFREGILGDLIGAGGNIAAMHMGRPPTPARNPFRTLPG